MSEILLRVIFRLIPVAVLLLPIGTYAGPAEDYERGLKAYLEDDLITAMNWLRSSADAGHTQAQVMLAYILDKAEDNAQAFELYTQAAEKGDPEGQAGLADMYAAGEGVEQDYGKAVHWYTRAAESGSLRAIRTLATAYLDGGLDLEPDREKAIEWLNRGASLGDVAAQAKLREITQDVSAEGTTQP
jgi:TPR repeat protein